VRTLGISAIVALAAAVVIAAAAEASMSPVPVVKQRDRTFGAILATRTHKALYYWSIEKRDFKVHCTGACARAWPPLVVREAGVVPRRIKGITGVFGVIKRPDGRLQVTRNRLPVYTYAHEGPNQVLCNNVDGWFVIRV
jgi:predicted lipoprotein with Yx(FWY)xxD motif